MGSEMCIRDSGNLLFGLYGRAVATAEKQKPHGLLSPSSTRSLLMSHHAERISLSVVRGVNRAIRSHLATLSARLTRHFPESESWSGAKSEAKLRKSTKYPGGRRVNSRYARVLRKIPGILPIWPKIWLILGPNQPQTRLRAKNLTISTQSSRENREEKRGCCREKRKGKQTGCERQTWLSPKVLPKRHGPLRKKRRHFR